jgi:hypothetical protein
VLQKNQNQLHLQDDQPLAPRGTRSLLAVSLTILTFFIFQNQQKKVECLFSELSSRSLWLQKRVNQERKHVEIKHLQLFWLLINYWETTKLWLAGKITWVSSFKKGIEKTTLQPQRDYTIRFLEYHIVSVPSSKLGPPTPSPASVSPPRNQRGRGGHTPPWLNIWL